MYVCLCRYICNIVSVLFHVVGRNEAPQPYSNMLNIWQRLASLGPMIKTYTQITADVFSYPEIPGLW